MGRLLVELSEALQRLFFGVTAALTGRGKARVRKWLGPADPPCRGSCEECRPASALEPGVEKSGVDV
jgi:hypothetical protein